MAPTKRKVSVSARMLWLAKIMNATELTPNMPVNPHLWFTYHLLNGDGNSKLHMAICRGPQFEKLCCRMIKVTPTHLPLNIRNRWGSTALHLAAYRQLPRVIRMLLLRGADFFIKDSNGNTALSAACLSGDQESVLAFLDPVAYDEMDYLTEKCALHEMNLRLCLEQKNYTGHTSLHIAVARNDASLARILLVYGASVNARTSTIGCTALHMAVEYKDRPMVDLLLAFGADINARTNHMVSILQLAYDGSEEIMITLLAAGALPDIKIIRSVTCSYYGKKTRNDKNAAENRMRTQDL